MHENKIRAFQLALQLAPNCAVAPQGTLLRALRNSPTKSGHFHEVRPCCKYAHVRTLNEFVKRFMSDEKCDMALLKMKIEINMVTKVRLVGTV